MKDKVHRGFWRHILALPGSLLEKRVARAARRFEEELAFLTGDHRRVHHLVVRELPAHGRPMEPGWVAGEVGLAEDRVRAILQELEENMAFLYRNQDGAVVWAYPVTVEETPHRLTFSTGEQIYAA